MVFVLPGEKWTASLLNRCCSSESLSGAAPDTRMPVTNLTFEANSQEKAACALFEALGKFWGKITRKSGLARECARVNWITSCFYQKIQSRRKQQIRMLTTNYWGKQDKNKAVWEIMIPSHPTLTSKNLQEQKWTLLGSGIAMKMTNLMAKYSCPSRHSVQIISKAELCQPEDLKCLYTGTVTGHCKGWYSKENFHLFCPSCLTELLSTFRIYGFNLRRI